MPAFWQSLPELETGIFSVPKWVTQHDFLQPRVHKSAINVLEKPLNGSQELMAFTVL